MTQRLLPLTGVGFFVLFLAGYVVGAGGSPDDTASGQAVVAAYAGHQNQMHSALMLLAIASVLLTFFVAYLHSVVGAAGNGSRPLAAAVLAGGTIWSIGLFASAMTQDATLQAALHGQVSAAATLNVLAGNDFFPIVGGIASVRSGALPV